MYFLAYVAFFVAGALYFGYAKALDNAVLYWGKRLTTADNSLPMQLHGILKPRGQTARDVLFITFTMPWGFMFGIIYLNVVVVIAAALALPMLCCVAWRLFPKEDALFFHSVIARGLADRIRHLERARDGEGLETARRALEQLRQMAPP